MTVAELITELQKLDQRLVVAFECPNGTWLHPTVSTDTIDGSSIVYAVIAGAVVVKSKLRDEKTAMEHIDIRDVNFSRRTENVLHYAGYKTLGDIASNATRESLLAIPNLGHRSLNEIKQVMKMHGLSLKQQEKDQWQAA